MTADQRLQRADMAELMRLGAFRRFLLRQIAAAGIHQAGLGQNDRSLEYREGQRTIALLMVAEASLAIPAASSNPEGAMTATLIQILQEADQTARKEIARGGSRDLDDGDDPDGDPV